MKDLASLLEIIENGIENLDYPDNPDLLYNPIRYIMGVPGKRIRPLLVLMAHQLFDENLEKAISSAIAIEHFHNFTLLHDDIMDNAPLRRGRPTVHEKWNNNIAILSGDVMMIQAYQLLLEVDHKNLRQVLDVFSKTAIKVCEGQQLDIEFEDRIAVSEEDYFEMIEGKTAVMFLTCAEVGSRMAGADDETIQCMADWGLAVGLCFQLMDDLIDVLSDSDTLGKPAGSDLAQGKRTLMVIHALSQSDSGELDNLKAVLGKGEDATQEQIDLGLLALNKIGSVDYAKKKAEMYHSKAHACLDRLPDSPAILALRELTDYQLKRIS